MDILTEIVETTRAILDDRRRETPMEVLRDQVFRQNRAAFSLRERCERERSKPQIIAEFKRKSPSRPDIALDADPVKVAEQYALGGAAAMSVLTEPAFFAGSPDDLRAVRARIDLPVLRKDFMIDRYQFYEAKAMGADLVLLIARILAPGEIVDFCHLAHELGMEVLCEIHNLEELERIGSAPIDFLGVNCRDLERFQTNLDSLIAVVPDLPRHIPLVAESGIHSPEDLQRLWSAGYRLFLIGEYLMKHGHPENALRELGAL